MKANVKNKAKYKKKDEEKDNVKDKAKAKAVSKDSKAKATDNTRTIDAESLKFETEAMRFIMRKPKLKPKPPWHNQLKIKPKPQAHS